MKKVYCVGLMFCDIPLRPVTKEIFDNEGTPIEYPIWATGGDATNTAAALSRLGFDASLTGLVGNDKYGDFIIETLIRSGVNIEGVQRHPELGTAVSYVIIEPSGERHFLHSGSINGELTLKHINKNLLEGSDLVYIGSTLCLKGMDYGGNTELFKMAHSLGKLTATDFGGEDRDRGDYWLKTLGPFLRETDILLPSYREAKALTGKKELPDIRAALAPFGIKILVVKLGGDGCYITDFKDEWKIPVFKEFTPIDTTGAGDSFCAGFIRGYLEGWSPESCGLFASAVAGFNVTKVGAVAGVPDFQTAYNFVKERCGG